MDKVTPPKTAGLYVDRDVDCEEAMDYAITDLLDRASTAGWSVLEAFDTIKLYHGSAKPMSKILARLMRGLQAEPQS